MAVGGLVLSLAPDPVREQEVRAWLGADPRLQVGPCKAQRLAVVAVTETLAEGRDLCESLLALPGIRNLEVAYVAPEESRAQEALEGGR